MSSSPGSSLTDLAKFLIKLGNARIHYTLTSVREGAVMVQVVVPGERWEIEFFPDREPEIEIFRSQGVVEGDELLERLFQERGGPRH